MQAYLEFGTMQVNDPSFDLIESKRNSDIEFTNSRRSKGGFFEYDAADICGTLRKDGILKTRIRIILMLLHDAPLTAIEAQAKNHEISSDTGGVLTKISCVRSSLCRLTQVSFFRLKKKRL